MRDAGAPGSDPGSPGYLDLGTPGTDPGTPPELFLEGAVGGGVDDADSDSDSDTDSDSTTDTLSTMPGRRELGITAPATPLRARGVARLISRR